MAACVNHPESKATASCFQCLKPICDVCSLTGSMQITCIECGRAARKRGAVVRVLGGVVAACAVAAVAYGFVTYESPFDYGERAADVRKLKQQLEKEPCDRIAIVKLGDAMVGAGDNRGALTAAQKFLSTCGEHERLRWITYEAHRRLSEHDLAIAEATKLIESDPYDPDFWWWRGRSHADKGDHQRAMEDHKRVTTLCPQCLGQWDLADALEKLGRPCEAIDGLATILRLRKDIQRERIERRLESLRAQPECKDWSGTGDAKLKFEGGHAFAETKINGIAIGRALVDTGASSVVITPELASKIGLRGPFLEVKVKTADGVRDAKATIAELIEVNGLTARHVPIVIHDGLATGPLLGMSFLSRFDVVVAGDGIELKQRKR